MLKKRIPTIVGLLLLIFGALGGVMFINQKTDFLPRAAPEYTPQKVKITNVSENGFTISWITKEATIGFVKFGEATGNLNQTAIDDRDLLTGTSSEYRTHYISIQNLKPSTAYYFKLGSQKNQLFDNNGEPFSLTTPAALTTPPPADTAYGTVITPANTPAEGAIVYVSMGNSTPVSALVKQNGNWATNLSTARTVDFASYSQYDQNTRIDLMVQPATGEVAQAITSVGNTKPVPTITLGQTLDFSNQTEPAKSQTAAEETGGDAVEPTPLPESKFSLQDIQVIESDKTLSITTLPKDGTVISEPQPEIGGKAPANTTIMITVHSDQAYTDQLQVDQTGNWQWVPPENLEPGEHSVTLSYTDDTGVLHKLTRYFVVQAAEPDALAYTATPSASVKPTATPKPSATPKPTPRTTVATESSRIVAGATGPTYIVFMLGVGSFLTGWWVTKRHH